jgi:hypothetical protein
MLDINTVLLNAVQTGRASYDTEARDRYLAIYIIGSVGAVGRVVIREAHVADYGGSWQIVENMIDVPSNGLRVVRPVPGVYRAIEAEVIDVMEAGTVTVLLQGNKEP